MLSKATKVNLLDHFYDHLEEGDWLEGVDLYQAGRVSNINTFEGLITGTVTSPTRSGAEVRLKILPSGHCIQWIECTCRKNRALGYYCEHIAAFMIHVDRERPELFAGLDTSMPIKPPSPPKKARLAKTTAPEWAGAETKQRGQGAAQTILDHLKGNIQNVTLLAHGPTLRVRIEIKQGTLTHYDLSLDQSAKFLISHPKLTAASPEVKALCVYDTHVELGTRIYQAEPEKIVAERVASLRIAHGVKIDLDKNSKLSFELGRYKRVTTADPEGHEEQYLFVPLKTAAKLLGKEYFFLPGHATSR